MERLTTRVSGLARCVNCIDHSNCYGNDCGNICGSIDKLKEYEDTGLTPDQIRELKERDTAKPLIERHYEDPGEEPYIKYTCPNGCKIQPYRKSKFCSLCGQRLKWGD